ncbi:MAG: hypothetical protein KDA67_01280 [Rhodobacteraceae bacterium]|nr:hypothetical protein [Paracoccaceae bacterium]
MAFLIAMPSFALPGSALGLQDLSVIFALAGAALTLFEYGSSHPGLIEFRFAPPYNRIRFLTLLITVYLLSMVAVGGMAGSSGAGIREFGDVVGRALDFPFSPARIMTSVLSDDAASANTRIIKASVGVAYLVSLLSLAIFIVIIRLISWPAGRRSFNIWVNLPTFDPAAGLNIEERLLRDARINVLFGITLPFLLPMAAYMMSDYFHNYVAFSRDETLIWTVSLWAFLPANLIMRGIAIGKIARLIHDKRKRLHRHASAKFSPV